MRELKLKVPEIADWKSVAIVIALAIGAMNLISAMPTQLNSVLSAIAILLSVLNTGVLCVVVGKLFFSTHEVEYITPERHAELKRMAGLVKEDEPTQEPKDVFGQPKEEFLENENQRETTRKQREARRRASEEKQGIQELYEGI